jgi:hypothetical protein
VAKPLYVRIVEEDSLGRGCRALFLVTSRVCKFLPLGYGVAEDIAKFALASSSKFVSGRRKATMDSCFSLQHTSLQKVLCDEENFRNDVVPSP